jgi:SPP1 gp7 family putative phage head morphogenesis protein
MNPKQNGHAPKKAPTLDSGDTIERLMRPYYVQLAKLAFDDANADHGLGVAFDLDNPYVQTVINQLAKQVRGVTDTTKQQIADITGRAAAEGWSNEQLAHQIRQLGVDMSRSRSLTIARTESASGYTQGSISAYQASGVVSGTTWLMGPDSCDICQALDGSTADLGGEFADGISGPPAHPRCTCVLVPIIAE